jgi:hypothetical protein
MDITAATLAEMEILGADIKGLNRSIESKLEVLVDRWAVEASEGRKTMKAVKQQADELNKRMARAVKASKVITHKSPSGGQMAYDRMVGTLKRIKKELEELNGELDTLLRSD